ncbi:hypothetical protein Tco_1312508 [Tanacetum coccineum]
MIITESSIRRDLHLEDADGADCLPTTTIFEELAKMGYEKPSQKLTFYKAFFSPQWNFLIHTITQSLSAKSTAWNEFSIFINQQLGDMSHHKKIYVNPSYTKKFFANMKRAGKDFSRRITPLFDTMMVQASEDVAEVAHDETEHEESVPTPSNHLLPSGEDIMQLNDLMVLYTQLQNQVLDLEKAKSDQAIEIASLKKRVDKLEKRRKFRTTRLKRLKNGRRIEDIDADADVTLVNETQERQDEDLMFDTRVLDGDEMFVDATTNSAAPTIPTTVEETLAQTLVEIKATKPKAKGIIFHDLEKQVSKPIVSIIQPLIKDKGKGIMQESERPLTKKDQVTLDEDLARNVQA